MKKRYTSNLQKADLHKVINLAILKHQKEKTQNIFIILETTRNILLAESLKKKIKKSLLSQTDKMLLSLKRENNI